MCFFVFFCVFLCFFVFFCVFVFLVFFVQVLKDYIWYSFYKIYHTAKCSNCYYIEGYKYRYIVEHGAQHVDWINIHLGVIGVL